jgi:hypothetical protein
MGLADSGRARPRELIGPEPVREFTGDHHRLARGLLQQLESQRADLAEQLVKGTATGSFDEYRYRCGLIEGIDRAIILCKQIQTQL